jgi:hypothetical protein
LKSGQPSATSRARRPLRIAAHFELLQLAIFDLFIKRPPDGDSVGDIGLIDRGFSTSQPFFRFLSTEIASSKVSKQPSHTFFSPFE